MPSRILLLWMGLPALLTAAGGWMALRAERERMLGELREQGQQTARRLASEMAAGWEDSQATLRSIEAINLMIRPFSVAPTLAMDR